MLLGTLAVEAHPVTPDTFLIPTIAAEPSGSYVAANSLVIRGTEPVLVDTGCSLVAADWLRNAFSVVEPNDVRWVVISHDDHDHIGNLEAVLDLCPNATLVANWSIVSRLAGDVELPLHRMRWVDPGQSLDVGDRTLHFVRPPLFDSPATRGVFDDRTGVLWAVDTFGALVQGAVLEADDADPELYAGSFAAMNTWNTPWLEWVDPVRFEAHVRTTASLPIEAVASAHGPVLRGDRIADAFAATLALAGQPYLPTPDQSVLDAVLAVLTETAGPETSEVAA
jgi:flavorubredoxin